MFLLLNQNQAFLDFLQVQNEIFDYLDAPIEKINTADTPTPYSPVLLKEWLPNSEDVISSVNKVLYRK